jgi:hypothetical protein
MRLENEYNGKQGLGMRRCNNKLLLSQKYVKTKSDKNRKAKKKIIPVIHCTNEPIRRNILR